jgi:hypothetical protein
LQALKTYGALQAELEIILHGRPHCLWFDFCKAAY